MSRAKHKNAVSYRPACTESYLPPSHPTAVVGPGKADRQLSGLRQGHLNGSNGAQS